MPAKSKAQRRLFGVAKALKKGELSPDEVSGAASDIAKNVSSSDIDKFAKTKEAGLPQHVEQKLREYIRKIVKEMISETENLDEYNINVIDPQIAIDVTGQLTYWPEEKWGQEGSGWYLELIKKGSTLPIGSSDAYKIPDELVKQMNLDSIVKEI